MKQRAPIPDARITLAATEWHALHREGPLTPAQQAGFTQWLLASPEHLREYLAITRLSAELGNLLRALPDQIPAQPTPPARRDNVVVLPLRARPTRLASARPRRLPRLANAAAVVLVLLAGSWLAWPHTAHYQTAHAQPRNVQLPDGTVVHLNARSALSLRYTLFGRHVQLEQGQASFKVAPGYRPFSVQAAGMQVRDIGTTFDVSLLREQARVGVVEGRVQLFADAGKSRMLADLKAGQSARVDYHDHTVRLATEDPAAITGWWRQRIVFRDEPLRDVADQFNRLNTVQVTVDDAAGALRLTGNLAAGDVDSLLAFLQLQPDLHTTRSVGRIEVSTLAKVQKPALSRS